MILPIFKPGNKSFSSLKCPICFIRQEMKIYLPVNVNGFLFFFFQFHKFFTFAVEFHRVVSVSKRFPVGKSLIQSKLVNKVAFHQFG